MYTKVLSMFIAELFTITRKYDYPRYPLTHKWIKETWYTQIMEFYLSINKNVSMIFARKWMH